MDSKASTTTVPTEGRGSPIRKKDRQKIIKHFFVFSSTLCPQVTGASEKLQEKRVAKAVRQYSTTSVTADKDGEGDHEVDESSVSLLCLPDGISVSSIPFDPKFHTFVITKQNGTRVYGSSLIVSEKLRDQTSTRQATVGDSRCSEPDAPSGHSYASKAFCLLTTIPFVIATKKMLFYFWKSGCEPNLVQAVCNLKLPRKGQCIKIKLPEIASARTFSASQIHVLDFDASESPEIYIYRGLSELPLVDYSLRQLFLNILSPKQFFLAFAAALQECQILITSEDYYKLMLVAETLTSLLLPFKWQHVYVPILPAKLGLHYLDAPTPYIMGVKFASTFTNSASDGNATLPSLSSHSVQCRVNCDENKVDFSLEADGGTPEKDILPPFLLELVDEIESILASDIRLVACQAQVRPNKNEALKRVVNIARRHNIQPEAFSYLDDLKINQKIRIVCMATLKKNILRDHERFIVNTQSKRDSVKFDVVSYLCDQPDSLKRFLTKFLETQMFASFIDDEANKLRRKARQVVSTGNETLMISSDKLTSIEQSDEAIETDLFDSNGQNLDTVFGCAYQVDLNENQNGNDKSSAILVKITSSPLRQRMKSQQANETMNKLHAKNTTVAPGVLGPIGHDDQVISSPAHLPSALTSHTNWVVVESLLREVKVKTKRILLEKMGSEEIAPLGCGSIGQAEENTLIASLCDLIERIWSHGTTGDATCHFWSHLVAYARLESTVDSRQQNVDSNYLTPALNQMALDSPIHNSTLSSPAKQTNGICHENEHFKPLPTTLLHDFRSVCMMTDVKTDLGKSRAFIRLALERKLLSKHIRTLLSNQDLLISMYKRYAFLRSEEEREQFITHLLTLNAVDLHCFTNIFTTSQMRYKLFVYGSGLLSGWLAAGGSLCSMSEIAVTTPCAAFTFKHRNLGLLKTLSISISQQSKLYIDFCFVRNEFTGHIYRFTCMRWLGRNIDDGATERVLLGRLVDGHAVGEILRKSQQSRSSSIGRHWSRSAETNKDENLSAEDLQQFLNANVTDIVRFYYRKRPSAIEVPQPEEEDEEEESLCITIDNGEGPRNGSPKCSQFTPIITMTKTSGSYSASTLGHPVKQGGQFSRNLSADQNLDSSKLLFGEKQLLWTLQQIFYYGFRNRGRSSFRKQIFFWDFILRVQLELKLKSTSVQTALDESEQPFLTTSQSVNSRFVELVEKISNRAANWGKDGKMVLFLSLSLRDQLLSPHFVRMLSKSPLAKQFYDSSSFLVNPSRTSYLIQILSSFDDIHMQIDANLTKNL